MLQCFIYSGKTLKHRIYFDITHLQIKWEESHINGAGSLSYHIRPHSNSAPIIHLSFRFCQNLHFANTTRSKKISDSMLF